MLRRPFFTGLGKDVMRTKANGCRGLNIAMLDLASPKPKEGCHVDPGSQPLMLWASFLHGLFQK